MYIKQYSSSCHSNLGTAVLRYDRALAADLEPEHFGCDFLSFGIDNDCWVAQKEYRAEVWAEVGAVYSLVLEVIRLEQPLAFRTEHVGISLLRVRIRA